MFARGDEGATSAIGAASNPRSVSPSLDDVSAESFDAAREITVVSLARGVVAVPSARNLPPGLSGGGVEVVAGEFDPCEVVSSGIEGTADVAVGVLALPGEPPVLEGAPDAVDGVEDFAGAEVSAPRPADDFPEDPDDESDDGPDGSAPAVAWPETTAAPTPSVISKPANLLMPHRLADRG